MAALAGAFPWRWPSPQATVRVWGTRPSGRDLLGEIGVSGIMPRFVGRPDLRPWPDPNVTYEFWVIDYRIFDPTQDGKTKLEHVADMLQAVRERGLPFQTVLMDSWYATKELMLNIDGWNNGQPSKLFHCPLKSDRQVDESNGERPYQRVDSLPWSEHELAHGKLIKIKGFPGDKKVKLFRVVVSSHRTEWIVSNDLTQDTTQGAQEACAVRWKIEEVHRELKQLTGIEDCQCRKARIQRNHIACALLVWVRLKDLAYQSGQSIYQLKRGLLHDYLVQQLKNPSIRMALA